MKIIAFQGEHGAYSESAAIEYFGSQIETLPCESFEAVFDAVEQKIADQGIIPIENSLAGSVHQNYDLLLSRSLHIIGEYHLRIQHCLIGWPNADIKRLRKVISHPQALAQCRETLKRLGIPSTEPVYDTAGAVRLLLNQADPAVAAIASRRAAEVYNMSILAEGIEDHSANFTRFLILSREAIDPPLNQAKTSIVFTLINRPGALFRALAVFALREIDLAKIESRPVFGRPGEYLFYVDFFGSTANKVVERALDNLNEFATMLRILGCYPFHPLPLS
ncbi:prephenate dehydratase [Thermanaerothrix sp. 4228-RoL]|jgi:prephenate dehydratase|uniref:Prephenate dehydratase n=2 Tax=Thermanaerothrix TaxID=1077886 RepID=A0ABU3NJH5_9CHLR|nr:prephenate dehydratase [Thermanaerothrix sp. 4228-RoL]MDT8897008.1 prephenate dehydratase [Thermanaerothrix sp. 4228-RoL]